MSRLIQLEYHRPGKDVIVYEEQLVLDRPDVKVLLQREYSGEDVYVADTLTLEAGAPIVWYIPVGAWHDIGRFHLKDGTLTGWYTNLSKPVQFDGDTWTANDLFLDLWQPICGEPVWLDQDELGLAVKNHLIDQSTVKRTLNERALVDLQLSQQQWPPAIARDIDLEQAFALADS
jgi:predicted RNA-binding protein associated with RNAse of E/G family